MHRKGLWRIFSRCQDYNDHCTSSIIQYSRSSLNARTHISSITCSFPVLRQRYKLPSISQSLLTITKFPLTCRSWGWSWKTGGAWKRKCFRSFNVVLSQPIPVTVSVYDLVNFNVWTTCRKSIHCRQGCRCHRATKYVGDSQPGGKNTPSLSSTLLANHQQDTKCSIFGDGKVTWTSLPSLERGTCSSIFHITFVHSWAFCCGVSDLQLHDHFTLYDSRYVSWPLIVMAIMSHLVPDAADVEDNSFVQLPRLLDDERVRRLGLKLLQYHEYQQHHKNVTERKIREDGGYFETELHLCKKRSPWVGRSGVPKTKRKT